MIRSGDMGRRSSAPGPCAPIREARFHLAAAGFRTRRRAIGIEHFGVETFRRAGIADNSVLYTVRPLNSRTDCRCRSRAKRPQSKFRICRAGAPRARAAGRIVTSSQATRAGVRRFPRRRVARNSGDARRFPACTTSSFIENNVMKMVFQRPHQRVSRFAIHEAGLALWRRIEL